MKKRIIALSIILLFVLPIPLSFVTDSGGSNLQNVTQPEKDSVLSYEDKKVKHTACGGNLDSDPFTDGDYWDTWEDDTSYLEVDSSYYMGISLIFNITESSTLEKFNFFLRWQVTLQGGGPVPTMYWRIYNFDTSTYDTIYSMVLSTTLNFEDREESITYNENHVNATNHVRFYVSASNQYADNIEVDYAYLTVTKGYTGEFRESLPDDVLYYPDPIKHQAHYGYVYYGQTNDYTDTWTDDAVYLEAAMPLGVSTYLFFNATEYGDFLADENGPIALFMDWRGYRVSGSGTCDFYWKIYNWDTSAWDEIYHIQTLDTGTEDRQEQITFDSNYIHSNNTIKFLILGGSTEVLDNMRVLIDYAFVEVTNNYTESFTDISDWTFDDESAGLPSKSFTSDGDILTFEIGYDDVSNEWASYTTNISVSLDDYLEVSFITSLTTGSYKSTRFTIYLDSIIVISEYNSEWNINKILISDYCAVAPSNITLHIDDYANAHNTLTGYVKVDYISIGPSTEMGWQHDCSTIEAISAKEGGYIYTGSSDGDIFTSTSTYNDSSKWAGFKIYYDPTTTSAKPCRTYYPFMEIKYRYNYTGGVTGLGIWMMYDGYGVSVPVSGAQNTWNAIRSNILVATTEKSENYVWFYAQIDSEGETFTFDVDYATIYTIANYTITESSTTTDDFLYVESGVLYSEMDNGYFILDYDPAFLVNGSYSWTKTPALGTSYISYKFGPWSDYTNATTGFLGIGETTGIRIKFNETSNIQEIEYTVVPPEWRLVGTTVIYFDLPNWWIVGVAVAGFYIPIGELTLQFLLMIMGLVMIPFSTLFLVKGGRDEMSKDKLFFFLLIFLCGWALVLGGLM